MRKAIEDSISAAKWEQRSNVIQAQSSGSRGGGWKGMVDQRKERENAISRTVNTAHSGNLSSKANELIEAANLIKNKLAVYKEEMKG